MTPTARRRAVDYLPASFGVSERRASQVVGIARSALRYASRPRADEARLRRRPGELAAERRRFGYRRLHVLLRREGLAVNHKRVERLDREAGLAVRRRRRKRAAGGIRWPWSAPLRPDERWSLDFVSDALAWGRRIRLPAVLDVSTRESLASEAATSLPGERVVRVLDRIVAEHGLPREIAPDNGPELTGRALDRWAYERGVRLRFGDPGQPVRNAFVESFSGRLRDACLNEHRIPSPADARRIVEAWRLDDNRTRPHSSLGYRTPEQSRRDRSDIAITDAPPVGLS